MTEQGALFEQEETCTVTQLTARIHKAVLGAFPAEVWVRGEVEGLRPPTAGGHVYLTLREKARGRDTASLGVVLLRQSRLRIDRVLAAHPGFHLADGIEVRVRGRVQYAYGRIQLVVSEVDPVHTLGRLAAERDRVLAALGAEGLLGRNAAVPLPPVPLRLAVVTSDGSAACHDVLHELEASGIGFRVGVADARVQGHGAEASICAGLTRAITWRPDAVLLVRGGGSRTDLAAFDGERIARLIAGAPVPVITGIGHEIDTSVADVVAAAAHKTPTACAASIVDHAHRSSLAAEATWSAVATRAVAAGRGAEDDLASGAAALVRRAAGAVGAAEGHLDRRAERIVGRASLGLAAADVRAQERADRVARSAAANLATAGERLAGAARGLDPVRLDRTFGQLEADLTAASRRVAQRSARALADRSGALDVLAARAAAVDPALALARGWSITRTDVGTLVRSAADVVPGDALRTTFADGIVRSTVDRAQAEPTPAARTATTPEDRP